MARTVEGDLGIRWTAPSVVDAARDERLLDDAQAGSLLEQAHCLAGDPRQLDSPGSDALLAELAVRVAVRRHGRPNAPTSPPRPLRGVGVVVGSGGVLRHGDDALRRQVLGPLLHDHAGGWHVPDRARLAVDGSYVLFAAGLLAAVAPAGAARLASTQLDDVPV